MPNAFLAFIIIYAFINESNGQKWEEPYFLDPHTEGIKFEKFSSRQPIRMNEELDRPIKLAIINYNGPGIPFIEKFTIGSNQSLHLSIEKGSNQQWEIFINTRQDYENPVQRLYEFHISIESYSAIIYLITMNIFDNDPSITYDGPCVAPELHANYNTNCKFTVYDPDGVYNNTFTLKIEGSNNEAALFEFKSETKIDDYTMEYTLYVKEELRYEERALYNFRTIVYDVANNNGSLTTILEVEDIPSLPPIWVTPFATARFLEKQPQNFNVKAIDGDTGINKKICYKLDFKVGQDYSKLISIDGSSGNIAVEPINRDELKQEVFPFTVVAYKCDNETWAIDGDAVIIVDDVNDNYPEINVQPETIKINEATYLTLPLDKFIVNDIDLGRHATYNVELKSLSNQINYAKPFTVIPNKGYQESNFTITVSDALPLDYEDDDWRSFTLSIVSTEEDFEDRFRKLKFNIDLINWNDELPIFNQTAFVIEVNETIPENEWLTTITATDRDIDDHVIHKIVGLTDLKITEDGVISTQINDTFDYERQTSVIVQIEAKDTLQTYENEKLNVAFAQLIINVLDINDETPDIRMPRTSPTIVENSPAGTLVTDGILASDPDGTAYLNFTINWEESYATKAGQSADKETYENCFIIEVNRTNPNKVIGSLVVNPEFKYLVDYEMYEVIYLSITVTDLNQTVNEGSAEGVLTVRVEDVNDNEPEFILNTLETERSVVEEALDGNLIGTIYAIDIDGPQFNKISYSMSPANPETPPGLVDINIDNGAITVKNGANIDCDFPIIHNLSYVISLTDGLYIVNGTIQIRIIDINNKWPQFRKFDSVVKQYENITTGHIIQEIPTFDLDRDSPHNIVRYTINNFQYFDIDILLGTLKVKLQPGMVIDRDRGETEFDIQINIEDNYLGNGRTNTNSTSIRLILLDVNDNAPEMPSPDEFQPLISENMNEGETIAARFYAPDIDDDTTPNAWVGYEIIAVKPARNTYLPPPNGDDLFNIETYDKKYAIIRANKNLKGYYGTWLVTIEAFDHGHQWDSQIQLNSTETYEFTIDPYNFHAPTLVNPTSGKTYRLSIDDQQVGRPLMLTDKTVIPPFEAEDPDGGIYGNITFEMANYGSGQHTEYFELVKDNDKKSTIYLSKPVELKFYQINVRANDGGGKSSEWASNIVFVFVDLSGEPYFEVPNFETDFTENVDGLDEQRLIPEATDPKNVGIEDENEKYLIFYFIDYSYRPDDANLFELSPTSRTLTLREQLDRESIDSHEIRVIATNRREGPDKPKASSMLLVHISVNDVNDNPPTFEQHIYGSGITVDDKLEKEILTVKATDPDLDDVIRYVIVENSLKATGEHLDEILSTAFTLNENTGVVKLNFRVLENMKGFIEFKINAFDLVDHSDECDVKIFIISESNRVTFVLSNSREIIAAQAPYLIRTFSEFYKCQCNIDDIEKAEINGLAQDNITNVRAHFIQNNEAIESSNILAYSNDVIFISNLKATLLEKSIILLDVPDNQYTEELTNFQLIITIVFVCLTVALAVLLVLVIFIYFYKTRGLKRQLKALSTTHFGSDSSNLNRQKAPTTNVFSVEGSNPVLNNNELARGVFDNISLTSTSSDDSDFMGIDNDPTFLTNGQRDITNLAIVNGMHKRSSPVINGFADTEHINQPRDSDFGTHKF